MELAEFMAKFLKEVIVNQFVSPSTQALLTRSNLRFEAASRNEVMGKPSWVTRCLGVVATKPETVNTSDITTFLY
jgi:hypothetical protein